MRVFTGVDYTRAPTRSIALHSVIVVVTFLSVFWFPWTITALFAFFSALWIPLLPLATGILFDALYWTPHVSWFPYSSLFGASITGISYFVRSRLKAGIIN